jgi:hypothetical protein
MNNKKIVVVVILAAMLMLSFARAQGATTTELPNQSKVLSFLNKVVQLDTSQYTVDPVSYALDYPSAYGGLAVGDGGLNFTSANSKLFVSYTTINDTLVNCQLTIFGGAPSFTQKPVTVLDNAKGFLERYQNFANATYTQVMPAMLATVDVTKNVTTVSGNVKLAVSNSGNLTTIAWMYTSNGVDFPQKGVTLNFENDVFYSFGDSWNLYKVGNDKLQISKQQAIDIAMQQAKNYTFQVSQGPNNYTTVSNFTIDVNFTEATLSAGAREPLTLYPIWNVQLYFDKLYYTYYGIQAVIWGDNGQLIFFNPTGMGGALPLNNTPASPSVTSSPSPSTTTAVSEFPPLPNIFTVVVFAVIAAALIGVTIALKKRHK